MSHVIAVGSTKGHVFVYDLPGAGKELSPDIKPAELHPVPTCLSLFLGCRRRQSYSNLLVPNFTYFRAAHGFLWATMRSCQSPAMYLLVFLHLMAGS